MIDRYHGSEEHMLQSAGRSLILATVLLGDDEDIA